MTTGVSNNYKLQNWSWMTPFSPPKGGPVLPPPRPAASCEPPASCFMPATQFHDSLVSSEDDHWDSDWNSWCSRSASSSSSDTPWLDAQAVSPISPPPVLPLGAGFAAASSGSDDAAAEDPTAAAPAPPGDGCLGDSPASTAPEALQPTAATSEPCSDASASPPLPMRQLAVSVMDAEAAAVEEFQAADTASSLSSPVGSDCRAATTPYEYSIDDSGRSCSMSVLSWDAQSSPSIAGGSGGGDPDRQHEEEEEPCWAGLEGTAWLEFEDCEGLRVVECDVWERELEAMLEAAAAAERVGGASLALGRGPAHAEPADVLPAAPCDLAWLVHAVVSEALFEPFLDGSDDE
ncbi:hypothetical protein PLESTB_000008300 [Pleodorina starrii]|uniref:Uncharacterized protein n=1 Tax=Pleodorina starrii TaxID=330485 RepID=A0A9W6EWI6_9CHLO|nr:hypothetical protein PLESTB_000008300 [Pleodorina starrii]